MNGLRHIVALRYVFVLVHILSIIGVLTLIAARSSPDPVASHNLALNQKLSSDDLRTSKIEPLIGRYLRVSVEAGKPVNSNMVSPQPAPLKLTNAIAAVIMLPLKTALQRGITDGASVIIRRNVPPIEIPGTVIKLDCDDANCMVVVSLPKLPGVGIDPDTFMAADILLAMPSLRP